MTPTHTDIIIGGGGMVGMCMAVALARVGISVMLIEKTPLPTQVEPTFDGRVSAIARGSMLFLEKIGVWELIAPHAEPIVDIRVSDGDSNFFAHYSNKDIDDVPFGYIVENRHIRDALQRSAIALSTLTLLDNTTIESTECDEQKASVKLADGSIVEAALLIATDGRHSALREMMGIKTLHKDYAQTAIVCTIAHTLPHEGLAQERFLPAGPFAVLPMSGNRSSLVWVEPKDRAPLYLELSDAELVQEITERVGDYLGEISLVGGRFSYPLSVTHATRYTDARFALMGDAAHGIHPIAGQGVNLGFRDASAMEELIRNAHALGHDIGSVSLLAHYERWRRFNNVAMIGVTHGLNQLFCSSLIPIKWARGLGLWVVQHAPPLKKLFMKHAMGLVGDAPAGIKKTA